MSGGFERRPGGANLVQHGPEGGGSPSPGKRTLTEQLVASQAAQVQRTAEGETRSEPAELHRAAQAGVSGPATPLPYADTIQASFGPEHDVSSIRAHVNGPAAAATAQIGAEAYATGNRVAFGGAPSLHTAAHEAAHVMQQRSGVQLLGGVGVAGDAHEQNADAVADRVVAGQSAVDLLPRGGNGGSSAVQMRRLPTNTGAMLNDPANPASPGANYAANSAGIKAPDPARRGRVDAAAASAGQHGDAGRPDPAAVRRIVIHRKTVLDPTAADPARRPISQIDMALSEGVTRKFVEGMVAIDGVPDDAAGANAFLAAHATAAEITAAHVTPAAHRDLWIKAILRIVGPITGPEARDLRVVHELVRLSTMWGTVLQHRDPGGFAD
jgi:hypothetical protein